MTVLRIKGDKHEWEVLDRYCIGRECLKLHPIQARGAIGSGTRFAGYYHYGCATRNCYGCPMPIPPYDSQLAAKNRSEGIRNQ